VEEGVERRAKVIREEMDSKKDDGGNRQVRVSREQKIGGKGRAYVARGERSANAIVRDAANGDRRKPQSSHKFKRILIDQYAKTGIDSRH
jgi:hypothetical protein